MNIPFNKLFLSGKELDYLREVCTRGMLAGNGQFTTKCQAWLESRIGCSKALLTTSCTTALEMAAILADIRPGDEVIMPSYTFVSTANAFVLRGGIPVFVDIRPDTLNIDETKIEAAITPSTKVIVPVHYAGVGCEMDMIMAIAKKHDLIVIEDAAQCIMANYKGRPLGGISHLGAMSFHESKNIISGEGGALFVNDPRLVERAEIIWEKGTNRKKFLLGQVDKYTWMDIGSSYLPSELTAAYLWSQLEGAESITQRRIALWNRYHTAFEVLEHRKVARRPSVPPHCKHNGHMYYLILPSLTARNSLIDALNKVGISAVFHYVPLHDSPGGRRFGRSYGELELTKDLSDRLLRLPFWLGLEEHVDIVIGQIKASLL
ncbi:MAG: dTDP-4-amino-4,6-dideoxygalactose transaminase [Arenimonas sp.]